MKVKKSKSFWHCAIRCRTRIHLAMKHQSTFSLNDGKAVTAPISTTPGESIKEKMKKRKCFFMNTRGFTIFVFILAILYTLLQRRSFFVFDDFCSCCSSGSEESVWMVFFLKWLLDLATIHFLYCYSLLLLFIRLFLFLFCLVLYLSFELLFLFFLNLLCIVWLSKQKDADDEIGTKKTLTLSGCWAVYNRIYQSKDLDIPRLF